MISHFGLRTKWPYGCFFLFCLHSCAMEQSKVSPSQNTRMDMNFSRLNQTKLSVLLRLHLFSALS